MASDLNIPVSDARAAIERQDKVGALLSALSKDDGFGGLYVEYGPYTVVVLSEPGQGASISEEVNKVGDSELAPYIKVQETPFTEGTLLQARADIEKLDNENLLTSSDIDITAGTVLLTVKSETDGARVQDIVDSAGLPIPPSHVLVSVGGIDDASSYGGRQVNYPDGNYCTTGFSVTQISGTTDGVTSAAHCPNANATEAGGTTLNFQAGQWGGNQDLQWFTTPGVSDDNIVNDAAGTRDITDRTSRASMFHGENLCHYGANSGYGCGQIDSVNFQPGGDGHSYNSTFILVMNDVVLGGDSGGPWFSGNSAFGTTKGFTVSGNQPVFSAQNYMDSLNIKVKTG
jgi:hypothetical protein